MNNNSEVSGKKKPYGLQATLSNDFVNNNKLLITAKNLGISGASLFKAFAQQISLGVKVTESNVLKLAAEIQKNSRAFGKSKFFSDKKKEGIALNHIRWFLKLPSDEQSAYRSLLKREGNFENVSMTRKK